MLEFLGSDPNSMESYKCLKCQQNFSFRSEDSEGEPDYNFPIFCPRCGEK